MNWLDSLIGVFSPSAGARRVAARHAFDRIRGLDAGKVNRATARFGNKASSGEQTNWTEVRNARERAWELWENNCYARKIVRTVVAQVIGCGLKPESQATKPNGEADRDFRRQAKLLWKFWCKDNQFDHTLRLALQEWILSGEVLIHKKRNGMTRRTDNIIPYEIELIACERLVQDSIVPVNLGPINSKNYIYRGIEFAPDGRRVAYHIYDWHPQDPRPVFKVGKTTRIPAEDIIHLYKQDRPDQIRGYTQFAPVVQQLKNINDYQEDEMMAAAVGACVVAGITTQDGAGGIGNLVAPAGARTVDEDGNAITRMQPGMFLDLRPGEKIEGFNPQRPNSQAEVFITHLLRGMAAGMPGVKSSTITMDYRQSSFSSEKSADNDTWRETEQVQEWLCDMVCQPIYDDVIEIGVDTGAFFEMDYRAFSPSAFKDKKRYYLQCSWSGPVALSINPTDDEKASELAIKNGTSSEQIECAARGRNLEEIYQQKADAAAMRKELGLPDPAQLEADVLKMQAHPPEPAAADKPARFTNA